MKRRNEQMNSLILQTKSIEIDALQTNWLAVGKDVRCPSGHITLNGPWPLFTSLAMLTPNFSSAHRQLSSCGWTLFDRGGRKRDSQSRSVSCEFVLTNSNTMQLGKLHTVDSGSQFWHVELRRLRRFTSTTLCSYLALKSRRVQRFRKGDFEQ